MLFRVLLACGTVCLLAAQTEPVRRDVIVVTGSYEPVPLEETDRSVRVLEVREEAALLSNTLADLLKMDASVDLRQRAPNNIQGDLSMRGGTFGQTLVLLNGMRLNDVQTGHHNMDLPVPPESVQRIEILRGSGSALYGSDAVGGVVNFIARPAEVSEFRLRSALGNFGANQQRASVTTVTPKLSQQFSFFRELSTGFRDNRDYRHLSLASTTQFSSPFGHTQLLLAHADRPFGAEQFYGKFNSWERTRTWFASARQSFGERTEGSLAFRRHTDLFVLYRDRPQVFTNRHAVERFQAAFRRRESLGQNTRLHYGVEGLHEAIQSNNLGSHSRGRGAAYLALDVRALRRFSFSLGAREEIHGPVDGQFTPTVAAGFWLSSRLKLRGSAGRAFRLPTFTDLYYHDPANRGSPDLRPETAWSYEAGLQWNDGGRLRAELTVFERRERDGIDYVRHSPADIWRATNFQRLRFTGVEASLTGAVARTHRLEFHYAALRGSQDALGGMLSRYVFNYPSHSGIAGWQATLPAGIVARTRIGALKRHMRDPYAVWDMYLGARRGRLSPFVQFTNLTAVSYQEIQGVDMPGRGVLGGLEIAVCSSRK